LAGAGEPGSWAIKPIQIIMHRKITTIKSHLNSIIILSILLVSCNSSNQPISRVKTSTNYNVDRKEGSPILNRENKINEIPDGWGLFNVPSSNRAYLINLSRIVNTQFGSDLVFKLQADGIGIIGMPLENQRIENVEVKLHAVSETIILLLDNNKVYDLSNDIEFEQDLIIESATKSLILK
jgi:hypothetical protein